MGEGLLVLVLVAAAVAIPYALRRWAADFDALLAATNRLLTDEAAA